MYQPTAPCAAAAILVEVLVVEEELRTVDAVAAIVNAADVELPGLAAALRLPDRRGQRHPLTDLPPEAFREVLADDGALPILQPRLHLIGRQLVLRIDLHERLGVDRHVREEVRRILEVGAEPGVCVAISTPGTAWSRG